MAKLINLALILVIIAFVNSDLIPQLNLEIGNKRLLDWSTSGSTVQISSATLDQLIKAYLLNYNSSGNPLENNGTEAAQVFEDFVDDFNSTNAIDANQTFDNITFVPTLQDLIYSYNTPINSNPYGYPNPITKPKPSNGSIPTLGDLIISYVTVNPLKSEAIFSSFGSKLPTYSQLTLNDLFDNYLSDPYTDQDLDSSLKEAFLFMKLLKNSGLVITRI